MGSYAQIQYRKLVSSSFLKQDCIFNQQNWKTISSSSKGGIFNQQFLLQLKSVNGNTISSSKGGKRKGVVCEVVLDSWSPEADSPAIASQLSALSLLPYMGFLYFLTKSKSTPRLTLFGFYFLLAFFAASTKVRYLTSLSNVDWLHGGAESLLMLTNLFIVLGLKRKLPQDGTPSTITDVNFKEEETPLI